MYVWGLSAHDRNAMQISDKACCFWEYKLASMYMMQVKHVIQRDQSELRLLRQLTNVLTHTCLHSFHISSDRFVHRRGTGRGNYWCFWCTYHMSYCLTGWRKSQLFQSVENVTDLEKDFNINHTRQQERKKAFTKGFWGCGERFVIKATTWDPVYYLRTTHGVGSWGFPHMVSALYTSNFPQALSTRPLWGVAWREGEQRGERKERWLMNLSSASLFPCLLYLLQ